MHGFSVILLRLLLCFLLLLLHLSFVKMMNRTYSCNELWWHKLWVRTGRVQAGISKKLRTYSFSVHMLQMFYHTGNEYIYNCIVFCGNVDVGHGIHGSILSR